MAAVAGYDRNRWGKRTKWFSLWRAYKTDKKRRAEDDAKLAQLRDHPIMREHTRQLAATNRVLAPELRAIAEIKRVLARR
jgi:hypothetical protein